MWTFKENYYETSDYKPPRPEPINVPAPQSISNILPPSITQEDRDYWHTLLSDVDNRIGEKTREEIYEEQREDFFNDYYAGLEKRLVSGEQPTTSQLYSYRLSREKWETENLVGIENSYEYEVARRKAFWDIMNNPEEYQYAKTGDNVKDTTNALTNDLILTRALYNKTRQVSTAEEVVGQFAEESSVGFAGGSVGGTLGAATGVPAIAAAGAYIGANESIYQFRKAKLGKGSPSVNSTAEKFLDEYYKISNMYLNKVDFNKAVEGLVDKYFTDENWEYWGDMSQVILSGQRSYLDMGPLTGLLIGIGIKGARALYKSLRPVIGPKNNVEAVKQAAKDSRDLEIYKQRKADGEDVVYDGEIVTGQMLKTSDNASPNAGMSKEGLTIDADSWETYSSDGTITMTFRDPNTGDIVRYSTFRSIGSGDISTVSAMKKQNMLEEVGTNVGVKDIDSTLENNPVTFVGTGADFTQPFESFKAAEKALARWNIQLKDNQSAVIIEQGTDQYYIGVVDIQEPYFNLGIKNIEREGNTTIFWHDREFDNFEDALEYRRDLLEMELEEQGLTPVSAGSAESFKEFKNKEKTGWDKEHPGYYGPGNYVSDETRGNPRFKKTYEDGIEEITIHPDSRYDYFMDTIHPALSNIIESKDFNKFVEKEMGQVNHSLWQRDRDIFLANMDHIYRTYGPKDLIEHLEGYIEDFTPEYRKSLTDNAESETYKYLMAKYLLKNKNKIKTNLMSSSVTTKDIKEMSGEQYKKLSDEADSYLNSLVGSEKAVEEYIYYDIKDKMLSPIGEYDLDARRTTSIMRSIVDKLIFKNPVRYTGDTLQELEDKVSKNRFGADIKIDYETLEKDMIKEYKKLLKDNDLEVLSHDEGSNIVVSNPKKLNKVRMIETITPDGEYIQEVVDNDYVIRYNKETGKYEIGEVRGGGYTLGQGFEDIKGHGNR